MLRTLRPLWFLSFLTLAVAASRAQELPPYAPPAPPDTMTTAKIEGLDFSLQFPKEFTQQPPKDLQAVMREGHAQAFGSDPESDPEHIQAEKCMHTLFYAISGTPTAADSGASPDSLIVLDVDRSCIPKKLKGDKALTQLTGSVLHLPGFEQLVQQMWFQGGGDRHIHSGMSAMNAILHDDKSGGAGRQATLAIAASSFVQKDHWILIAFLNGTQQIPQHKTFGYTSIVFGSDRPVLLFPYLLGNVNLVK